MISARCHDPFTFLLHRVDTVTTTVPEELRTDLMAHARRKLGPAVAPREIDVVADLPHTRSGKIMRRLLKARELGLDEGDLSTLETGA